MSPKQSLGRGFDALIPKELDDSLLSEDPSRVQKLLITDIVPNEAQPRRELDDQALRELALSIKQHGVLQPIVVIKHKGPKGSYKIVAGERRWRAAKAAGLKNIPAVVRSLKELEVLELSLIENIQRVDLSPLEQAFAVLKLQQQFSLKLEEIAAKLGKAPSTISNLARLLQLPPTATDALNRGKISEGHARAILAISNSSDKQAELLRCILNNGWTVRQAEQFVINAKRQSKSLSGAAYSNDDAKTIKQVEAALKTKAKILRRARGGQIIIAFGSDEQLDNIRQKLTK